MSLNLPSTASEIDQRAKVDVAREIPNSNPFLKNSWLGALVTAFANRIFDFYYALRRAELEAIPDTAVDRLEQWSAIWGITRNAASRATGNVVATSASAGITPVIGTSLVDSEDNEYEVIETEATSARILAVASITSVGGIATVTTIDEHKLSSSIKVTIAGANESEYNVSNATITVTGLKTFTYSISGAPASPATGTITATTGIMASVKIQSVEFGKDQNLLADETLDWQSPTFNLDATASVDFGAIGGGTDLETDTAMRERLLDAIQNPVANFNVSQIVKVAKAVAGVTRVFVEEVTPEIGAVTIYFMRDNDTNPIPDSSEVAIVKAAIDAIKPANSDTADVIVSAPTAVATAFTFTDLQPTDKSMEDAVTASLKEFFANRTIVGQNVDADAYRSAIFNTVDVVTGKQVTTFTLSAPVGDITITAGEIATLGNITYP